MIHRFVNLLIITLGLSGFTVAMENKQTNFDKLWDYFNPAETRAKFEKVLADLPADTDLDYRLQLQTQIARTWGLDGQFDSAHALLDRVEAKLTDETRAARVRYLLERGRTFRSSGDPATAEPLFLEAFEKGGEYGTDYHTVDAAHMMALVVKEAEARTEWNLKGIDIAERSDDTHCRHWLGSIYNNVGWDYHDAGKLDSALTMFTKALQAREEEGVQQTIDIANWCIARCLRSLGRNDEAFEIQLALYKGKQERGDPDRYVCEELGELYLLKGDKQEAAKFFAQAVEQLSKDKWFVENEADRFARMKELAKAE